MSIDLKSLKQNSPKVPIVIFYGHPGIGKTTLASEAEDVIFILTEDGLGKLKVKAIPVNEEGLPRPAESFDEVLECLATLGEQEHGFKTVVIDSLDHLEPLIHKATCKRIGVSSIEEPGYGKGYNEAMVEWQKFFDYVKALRDVKGLTVIMLAHSQITRVEDPQHPSYDTIGLKLNKKASSYAVEKSDIVGYVALKTLTKTEEVGFGEKRNRAVSTGERVIFLIGRAAFTAKNRLGDRDVIPMKWEEFVKDLPSNKEKK